MVNPWAFGAVAPGDRVSLLDDDGQVLFTGAVESADGTVEDVALSVGFFDEVDLLSQPLTMPAWMSRMSTPTGIKWCGLSDVSIIDYAVASVGFESTPRPTAAIFLAPLQGTAWMPDRPDDLVKASESADPYKTAIFHQVAWGRALIEGDVRIKPKSFMAGDLRMSSPLQIGLFTQSNDRFTVTDSSYVRVIWDEITMSSWVGVQLTPDYVRATFFDSGAGGTICQIARTGTEQHINMIVAPDGQVTLTDGTLSATGSFAIPSTWAGADLELLRANASWTSPGIGGVYVTRTPTPTVTTWERTAYLNSDDDEGIEAMQAFPAMQTTPLELLKSHGTALQSAAWLDENGHLQWWGLRRLLTAPVARTLTATNDLLSLPWKTDSSEAKSLVQVNFKPCIIERGWQGASVLLYQGPGSSVTTEGPVEVFVGPSSDEEWYYPVFTFLDAANPTNHNWLNYGFGSFASALLTKPGQDDTPPPAGSLGITVTTFETDLRRWKLTFTATGIDGDEALALRTPETATITTAWQAKPLPIIRGLAKATWSDDSVKSATLALAPALPPLEINGAFWIQRADEAQRIADWVAGFVLQPKPRITSVPIVPDLNLRLGQKIILTDDVHSGISLTVLITGIDLRENAGQLNMTIDGIVLETEGANS